MNYHEAVLVSAVDRYFLLTRLTVLDVFIYTAFILSAVIIIASIGFMAGRVYERCK